MEAAHDEAVALRVDERQREALVAARVLERVVADQPDAREGALRIALEDRRSGGDLLDVANDLVDPTQVRFEDAFEAPLVAAARQPIEPARQLGQPPGEDDGQDRKGDEANEESDDEGAEVGGDEGIEIDGTAPPGADPSLPSVGRLGMAGWYSSPPTAPCCERLSRTPSQMAKRTRQSGRRIAPKRTAAARPSSDRPAPVRPPNTLAQAPEPNVLASDRSPSGLTELEVQRAAELEAEVVAQERAAAEVARRRGRASAVEVDPTSVVALPGDINAPLSVRMAHEYAYVARDVRRILLTGGLMVAILAVLAILVNVLGVVTL